MKTQPTLSIQDLRLQRRWTRRRLAREAGISAHTVERAELGQRIIDVCQVAIADALEVDRAELFGEDAR